MGDGWDARVEPGSARAWVARASGVALLVLGAVLVWVIASAIEHFGTRDRLGEPLLWGFVGFAVLAVVGCAYAGVRLVALRPNRHGSLLPPAGWTTLAGCFGCLAIGIASLALATGRYLPGLAGVLLVLYPLRLCLRAARRLRRGARTGPPG